MLIFRANPCHKYFQIELFIKIKSEIPQFYFINSSFHHQLTENKNQIQSSPKICNLALKAGGRQSPSPHPFSYEPSLFLNSVTLVLLNCHWTFRISFSILDLFLLINKRQIINQADIPCNDLDLIITISAIYKVSITMKYVLQGINFANFLQKFWKE